MNQSNSSKQVLLSVIGVAILVVAVVGVSFAFFNYTRTGPANTIGTGEIHFSTDQSVVSVSNLFPISGATVDENTDQNVATTTVTISGWTSYEGGLVYDVYADSVDLKGLPIKVKVFKDGATTSTATLTQYDGSTAVSSGATLAHGTIAKSTTAPETMPTGTIKIVAYLDADNILITDTPASPVPAGYTGSPAPSGYINGTNTTGKTVVTTAEWNALAQTPATFKVKIVSTEGAVS